MPKLEKALAIALVVSLLFSAAFYKWDNSFHENAPTVLCEASMQQQWWAVVFPTLQSLPEGEIQLRLCIVDLFKNASHR